MIPGAGIYLRESLYTKDPETQDRQDSPAFKRKYFERKSTTKDEAEDRKSITLMKSSEDEPRPFSSLPTVFDFADFAATEGKVSSENEVFIHLIQRVRQDVTEASRLYASYAVTDYLESWPDKKTWIDTILLDIQRALNDIGVYMEAVRLTGDDGGTVGLRRKFEWILSHHKKLISKQQYLTLCHQSLMVALQAMQHAEMNATFGGHDPIFEAPATPWVRNDEREILRGPHARQKWRTSQRNLSVPSITVSEAQNDKADADSINSTPAELPGSTPEDMPDPDNLDLYSSQRSSLPSARNPDHVVPQYFPTQEATHATPSLAITSQPSSALQTTGSDPLAPRMSLDDMRPLRTAFQEPARASFDQVRPRAYSDQVRPRRSFDMRPPASVDQVRPLPTLSEKPIERYDSTASVSVADASTVPLTSMRYRPKAVHVKKPPPRHRSLPSELPFVSSQTSLMEDLSNWVLPASVRASYLSHHSTDTSPSSDAHTPATSVASSPVIPNSPRSYATTIKKAEPSIPSQSLGSGKASTDTLSSLRTPPSPKAGVHTIPLRKPLQMFSHSEDADKSQRESPTEERLIGTDLEHENVAPLDSLAEPQVIESAHEKDTEKSRSTITTTASSQSQKDWQSQPLPADISRDVTGAAKEADPGPVEGQSGMNVLRPGTPVYDTNASSAIETVSTQDSIPLAAAPTSSSQAQETRTDTSDLTDTGGPVATGPAMTAQAKRRAAHARRMQLAFGAD